MANNPKLSNKRPPSMPKFDEHSVDADVLKKEFGENDDVLADVMGFKDDSDASLLDPESKKSGFFSWRGSRLAVEQLLSLGDLVKNIMDLSGVDSAGTAGMSGTNAVATALDVSTSALSTAALPHLLGAIRLKTYAGEKYDDEVVEKGLCTANYHLVMLSFGTNWLSLGEAVVNVCEQLAGYGIPVRGEGFIASAGGVDATSYALRQARPDPYLWSGLAADLYGGNTGRQAADAGAVADVLRELAGITAAQADTVTHMRIAFASVKMALLGAATVYSTVILPSVFAAAAAADVPSPDPGATIAAFYAAKKLSLRYLRISMVTAVMGAVSIIGYLIYYGSETSRAVDRAMEKLNRLAMQAASAPDPTATQLTSSGSSPVLTVNPDHLASLARQQQTAAQSLGSAVAHLDTAVADMWKTHGPYVGIGNSAMGGAVAVLNAACDVMQGVCDTQAANTNDAATTYTNVDQEQGRDLDNQVLPG